MVSFRKRLKKKVKKAKEIKRLALIRENEQQAKQKRLDTIPDELLFSVDDSKKKAIDYSTPESLSLLFKTAKDAFKKEATKSDNYSEFLRKNDNMHADPVLKHRSTEDERKKEWNIIVKREVKRLEKIGTNSEITGKKKNTLDVWDDSSLTQKNPLQRIAKLPKMVPHSGQSYNPTEEDHKETIQMAYKYEMEKINKKRKITAGLYVNLDDEDVKTGGNDVVDGLLSNYNKDTEVDLSMLPTEEDKIKKGKKKKRFSTIKKRNIHKHMREVRRMLKKRMQTLTKEEMSEIKEILVRSEQRSIERKKEREEAKLKKKLHRENINPIRSTRDIALSDEIESRTIRKLNGDAYGIFNDILRKTHHARIYSARRLTRNNLTFDEYDETVYNPMKQ